MDQHVIYHTRESLGTQIKTCTNCYGQGLILGDEDAIECLCLKRLQLFETVGAAIFNARPVVYDERLRPDRRLLIQTPWSWLTPRILGMCARYWGTRIQLVSDVDLRDSAFRDRDRGSTLPSMRELMGAPRLLILRLGSARKSEGLDGLIAEAVDRREVAPLWVCMQRNYHSRTERLMAALEGFTSITEVASAS
jgi:hypothetical protein